MSEHAEGLKGIDSSYMYQRGKYDIHLCRNEEKLVACELAAMEDFEGIHPDMKTTRHQDLKNWRYLYENTRFYWNFQNGWYWPFSAVLKSDIKYSIGIGKYRYWLVFFAAEIGLLVEMVFMREVSKKNKPSI